MRDLLRYFRSDQNEEAVVKTINQLTKNTEEKLRNLWIKEISQRTQTEINDLVNNYLYFLYLYHTSQEAHSLKGENIIKFDRDEIKLRLEDLLKLTSVPLVGKIEN
jgi:chemotaxis regulatin CheY-phosphate phosphatase CheZ